MVQKMVITSPIPVFKPLESWWVVHSPEISHISPLPVFNGLKVNNRLRSYILEFRTSSGGGKR